MPANAFGVWLDRGVDFGDTVVTPSLILEPTDGPPRALAFAPIDAGPGVRLAFDELLPVGATLRFEATSDCFEGLEPARHAWTIVEPLAAPTSAGTLVLGEVARYGQAPRVGIGYCAARIPAGTARVELSTDPSLAPWFDLVAFQTFVDGSLWVPEIQPFVGDRWRVFGDSWVGLGVDEIFTYCDPAIEGGLEPGMHTITMRALLPDGTVLDSNAVDVELQCRPPGETSSCAAAPTSGSPSALAFVAMGLVAIGLRRRRSSTHGETSA